MLVGDRFGAAVTALLRYAGIVADAVEADLQIGAAAMARFAAPRLAGEGVFPAAIMTMTCQHISISIARAAMAARMDPGSSMGAVVKRSF